MTQIRTRTGEGRERAKARGVNPGRKPKLTDHQKREAIRRRDVLDEPVREITRSYNLPTRISSPAPFDLAVAEHGGPRHRRHRADPPGSSDESDARQSTAHFNVSVFFTVPVHLMDDLPFREGRCPAATIAIT